MAKWQDGSIEPDEFNLWYSPFAVGQVVGSHFDVRVWRPLLYKRLLDEDIKSAARKVIADDEPYQYVQLHKSVWEDSAAQQYHAHFWSTGDIQINYDSGWRTVPDIELSCVDVRFDPNGIRALVPAGVPKLTPERQVENLEGWSSILKALEPSLNLLAQRSRLEGLTAERPEGVSPNGTNAAGTATNAQVEAWFASLPSTDKVKGIRWLWPAAKKALHPLHVQRKQVEGFVEGRPKGRPRTRE